MRGSIQQFKIAKDRMHHDTTSIRFYQVWGFTACAIGKPLRRTAAVVLPLSCLLFLSGVGLAVFVVVPVAVRFLIGYGSDVVRPFLAVGAYTDFVSMLALAFGSVFQIPLVLMFLHRAGVVTHAGLSAKRR